MQILPFLTWTKARPGKTGYQEQVTFVTIPQKHFLRALSIYVCVPVKGDADEDVSREEEAEDLEEGADSAEDVARRPHHRRRPSDLHRHHQKRHLQHTDRQTPIIFNQSGHSLGGSERSGRVCQTKTTSNTNPFRGERPHLEGSNEGMNGLRRCLHSNCGRQGRYEPLSSSLL